MSGVIPLKEIIPYDDMNWASNINAYQRDKKALQWGNITSKPKLVTYKMMKESDCKYNPVIQRYSNESEDKLNKAAEQTNLKRSLSQYYDNSLRYQQTYDVINLTDRLKAFENHPNHPQALEKKQHQKQNKETTKVNYNILSNISLNQHSPLPPEMRSPNSDDPNKAIVKPQVINSFLYKDYDILSNRYKDHHEEKSLLDHQIKELNASKQLQERKGYDFINCRAYNKDIQEQYNLKANQQKKIIAKPPLYNPVNHAVMNEERLTFLDQKESNRTLRYKVKQSTEDYYKNKAIEDDIRKDLRMKNHQSYSRYRAFDQRGYEVINHLRNFGYYRKNFNLKNDKSDWEVIQKNTSENGTFSTKPIYKSPYDKSDLDDNLDQFYLNRKALLGSLPKLEDETSFKRCHNITKLDHDKLNEEEKAKLYESLNENRVDINKNDWFSKKKVVGVGL